MTGISDMGVLILAAGSSSRLGQPKQLISFGGRSLLQRVIDEADQYLFNPKVLMLGAKDELIYSKLKLGGFSHLTNEQWQDGMGTSIQKGSQHALKLFPDLQHLMILLSDQPFVTGEVMDKLMESHLGNQQGITASQYGENIGVPAIFSKPFFEHLLALSGDQGAKKIMLDAGEDLYLVDFPKGEFDIDTPADVQRLAQLDKTLK